MAADVDIISRVEFRVGGIVDGMDDAIVDWQDVFVDVGEVRTGGGVVVTIEELRMVVIMQGVIKSLGHYLLISRSSQMSQ